MYVQMESFIKQEADNYKNTHVRTKFQQWGGHYGNITPTDINRYTQMTVQNPTSGGSDNIMLDQGASGANQETNRYGQCNTRK